METNIDLSAKLEGRQAMWSIDPVGRSGGLAMWWKDDIIVNILSSSENVINTSVRTPDLKPVSMSHSYMVHPSRVKG